MFRQFTAPAHRHGAYHAGLALATAATMLLAGCGGGGDIDANPLDGGHTTERRTTLAADPDQFTTRFESGEYLEPSLDGQSAVLRGVEPPSGLSDPGGQDTQAMATYPGRLSVQYQGGDASQRLAEVTGDPTSSGNHVLRFELQQANVTNGGGQPTKGRVQLNAYDDGYMQAREVRFTTRMYLPADVDALRQMTTAFDWLTISEWWNNAGWTGQAFPFRVAVNIVKTSARRGSPLNFRATAQTLDPVSQNWSRTVWQITNRSVSIPVGRWVTLEYSYLEGNGSTGRFHLAMTPQGGSRVVLFDVRSWTHHPDDPAPDGLSHVNPLKLYAPRSVIDHVRQSGGVLSVLWDDLSFRLCSERAPENSSPCAPGSFQ